MKRTLSLLLALLLLCLPADTVFAQTAEPVTVERIAGNTRYLTALELSKEGFAQSEYAVLASGANFPDALAGGQLAAYLQAPLITVHPVGVSEQLFAELDRLGVQTVYLLGGEAALSAAIEDSLAEHYTVERLAGNNRIGTSHAIASEVMRKFGEKTRTYYANGDNFPDALAAGPLMPDQDGVMLLNRVVHPVENGIAFGGDAAVPGTPDARIFGSNRYLTAVEIAKTYTEASDSILLVSGTNFPDALAAAGYAAVTEQPILLTHPDFLSAAVRDYLIEENIRRVTVIGGDAAVSDRVIEEIENLYEAPVPEEPVPEEPAPEPPVPEEPVPEEPTPPGGYDPDNPRDGLTISPYPDRQIKGNISSSGEKIYHVPGQRDYNKTIIDESQGERWFQTEDEAKAAGWRRALR